MMSQELKEDVSLKGKNTIGEAIYQFLLHFKWGAWNQ